MNQLDINFMTVLLAIAAVVAMVDIIVRLFVMPGRRDRFVGDLLDLLAEPCPETEFARPITSGMTNEFQLAECLLRHFEQSGVSRRVLSTLADTSGLTQLQLGLALNRELSQHGKAALPLAVTRRVATILNHAGLVTLDQGVWRATKMGLAVHRLLNARQETKLQPEAVAP